MRFFFICVGAGAIGFAACGGNIDGEKKQGGDPSVGMPTGTAQKPSSGVCCPVKGTSCGCAGGGGWATSADQCDSYCTADWAVKVVTDSHGCAALENDSSRCCGCPPPGLFDGGHD